MKNRKHIQILILMLVFIMPMLGAIYLTKNPQILQRYTSTNYGKWAPHSVPWPLPTNNRPWQLVLWQFEGCHDACMQQLGDLAKIRLAMGRKVYDLNLWVVVPQTKPLSEEQTKFLQNHDIQVGYFDEGASKQWQGVFGESPIVLVNPEKEVLLMYRMNPHAKKMFHDLQLLIK
jgi:hypothetical protein